MKVIPIPKEPGDLRELLDSGYDLNSINQRYKDDLNQIVNEYRLMAQLKGNANIVYCDDRVAEQKADGVGYILYIKMELLTPLTKVLADPASDAQVIKVGMDLCNALAACKKKNIIHRDIKPANIMVSADGNYKLGDFGVAKTAERTAGGTYAGTPNFMAPEVYNNRPYGPAVDIYSLGMVLYWMLNQRCGPFLPLPPTVPKASQLDDAKQRRFRGDPLPAPAHGSAGLRQIVLKACAFDPADRFSSPEEMYAALAALQGTSAQRDPFRAAPHKETVRDDRSDSSYGGTVQQDDQSWGNSWGSDYDRTQGTWRSQDTGAARGGTVGGTVGGGSNGIHIGPFDVRGQIRLTAQELASGCVKPFMTGSGKKINVTVKAGTQAGTVLRLAGAGKQDAATGTKGNAYITVVLSSAAQQDFWGEQKISGEVTISADRARTGGVRAVIVNGKKYMVDLPANLSDMQVITVDAKSSGGTERLTLRIRIQEPKKEKKKKKIGAGMIIWLLIGVVLLFAMPPVGIGWLVLAIPFLLSSGKE